MSGTAEDRLTSLFHQHADAVRAYASTLVPANDVDDVVSDTFLAAWRRIDDVPDHARGWLVGTTRRTAANRRRSTRRSANLVGRLLGHADPAPPPGSWAGADEDVPAVSAVREAMGALSERDREVLVLSAWLDLDNAAAAAVLGCSARTFAVRLHRAKTRLASRLTVTRPVPAVHHPLEGG